MEFPGARRAIVCVLRTDTLVIFAWQVREKLKPLASVHGDNSFRNRFNDITPLSAPAAATAGRSRVTPECTPTSAYY